MWIGEKNRKGKISYHYRQFKSELPMGKNLKNTKIKTAQYVLCGFYFETVFSEMNYSLYKNRLNLRFSAEIGESCEAFALHIRHTSK